MNTNFDKKIRLASDIKSLICEFVDLSIDEHLTQKINPESNKAWEKISDKLQYLTMLD